MKTNNHSFSALLLVFCITFLSSCEKSDNKTSVLNDHLLSYYKFNGNGNDETGNLNAMINNCSYTRDPFFNNNYVLTLNGDGYADLNSGFDYGSRSLSLWFKVTDIPYSEYSHAFVYNYENNQYGALTIGFRKNVGVNQVQFGVSSYNCYYTIALSTWYHAVIVTDGLNYRFYLNGILIDSGQNTSYFNSTLGNIHSIVGANRNLMMNMTGYIGPVRLYDKALSAEEVSLLYVEK